MMRAEIEAVLRKHHVTCTFGSEALITDLLALTAPPSWQHNELHFALQRLFDRHHQAHPTAKLWRHHLITEIVQTVRAGPRREAETKWCEHLEWVEYTSPAFYGEISYGEWIVKSRTHPNGQVSPQWTLFDGKFCPLCAAPRPEAHG